MKYICQFWSFGWLKSESFDGRTADFSHLVYRQTSNEMIVPFVEQSNWPTLIWQNLFNNYLTSRFKFKKFYLIGFTCTVCQNCRNPPIAPPKNRRSPWKMSIFLDFLSDCEMNEYLRDISHQNDTLIKS